jgi:hypothetical protein
MTGNGQVGHAFISHAPADAAAVIRLQEALESAGTPVWRDTSVLPGDDWRATIRRAINDDALAFVACFSRKSLAARASRQNEELTLAVEQMCQRRSKVDPLRVHVLVIRSCVATGSSQFGQVLPGPTCWHGRLQSWHHCWPR